MVGMQYTGNFINLAYGCFGHVTLLHEIAHSLGVWHEQSRPDRDQYVKINYHNMKCCKLTVPLSMRCTLKYVGHLLSETDLPLLADYA